MTNIFKFTSKDTGTMSSGVIIDFEHISCLFLVFLMLNLNKQLFAGTEILLFITQGKVGWQSVLSKRIIYNEEYNNGECKPHW